MINEHEHKSAVKQLLENICGENRLLWKRRAKEDEW